MALADAWEIVTETEPEWDDRERMKMLALSVYEGGVCACGFHSSLTHDKANHFTFDSDVCPVCQGMARFERMQAARDREYEQALGGDKAPPGVARLPDGRRNSTRLMDSVEVEERRQRR